MPPLEDPILQPPQPDAANTPAAATPNTNNVPDQQPKTEPMDQSESGNGNAGENTKQENPDGSVAVTEAKMEVDTNTSAIKEEKMDVDEQEAAEKEKEKEKEDTKPKLLLSGMENSQRKELSEIIQKLDGILTEEPAECTHLIMPKLSRTNNFLLCLPTVKFVLKIQWVLDCGSQEQWIGEDGYNLEDPEVENRFNFSLARTLARNSRDKLFSGKVFYLTPGVKPSLQIISQIITSSGGKYVDKILKENGNFT